MNKRIGLLVRIYTRMCIEWFYCHQGLAKDKNFILYISENMVTKNVTRYHYNLEYGFFFKITSTIDNDNAKTWFLETGDTLIKLHGRNR